MSVTAFQAVDKSVHALKERSHRGLHDDELLVVTLRRRGHPVKPLVNAVKDLALNDQIVFNALKSPLVSFRIGGHPVEALVDAGEDLLVDLE